MTYYEELGVAQSAANDEIKRAYFRKAREYSPQSNPDEFIRIRKAYEMLSDSEKRAEYDDSLSFFSDIPPQARDIIMQSEQLAAKGVITDAAGILERGIKQLSPDSESVNALRYALCLLYMNEGKSGKAVSLAESLVKASPKNTKYLRLAFTACTLRGWAHRARKYITDILKEEPGSEDAILLLLQDVKPSTEFYGEMIETVERHGGSAPRMSIYNLNLVLNGISSDPDDDDPEAENEQLNIFSPADSDTDSVRQPWGDLVFAADKLVEHTVNVPDAMKEAIGEYLCLSIMKEMFLSDRYEILPQIDSVIRNLGDTEIFETSAYRVISAGFMAKQASDAGIPNVLAAYCVTRAFMDTTVIGEEFKCDYIDTAVVLEIDILIGCEKLKTEIKRLRDEYQSLYSCASDFLEALSGYNAERIFDEINKRLTKLKRIDSWLTFDWLGEDDGTIGVYRQDRQKRGEPVRVEKIGRNDPCPCGSGLKYKKCCGR